MDQSQRCIPNPPQWAVSQQCLPQGWTPSALAWIALKKLGYWRLYLLWLYTYTQWECGEDKRVEPLHWVWQASAGKLWQCRSKCSCTVLPQARNPENQKERWVFHGWPLCSEKSPHGRWHRQARCQSSAREEGSHWERDIRLLFYSNVVKNNKYNMTTT